MGGGPENRISSKEALLLRGGRKGDPDTESGLGKRSPPNSISTFVVNRSATTSFFVFCVNFCFILSYLTVSYIFFTFRAKRGENFYCGLNSNRKKFVYLRSVF